MMVTIWRKHRDDSDHTGDTDLAEIAAIEAAYPTGHQAYDDFEYNPFEETATTPTAPSAA